MPIQDWINPITAGVNMGGSILSTILNNKQIQKTNEENKQFSLDMYNMNRRDALADWNRTNEYNSPAAQMQRFKDAGLSPHLIYGQMTNAPVVRTPEAPQFKAEPKQGLPIGESIRAGINTIIQGAEMNLLKKQIEEKQADIDFKKANTLAVLKQNDIRDFDLGLKNSLREYTIGQAINRTNLLSAQQQAIDFNTYANRQKLPKQIDLMLSQIASNKSKVVTDQYHRRLLESQSKLLKQKNYWYGLTEGQKYQMGNILQQSELYKQLLNQENISGKRLENSINEIRERNMRMGISNQATENAIKTILQLAGKK